MKILFVHKYLFPKGGAETYVLQLGAYLAEQGHEVQYFGMEHPQRCVGNRIGAYTREMEFHQQSALSKLSYFPGVIYSGEARRKMAAVLEDFQPDVVHLNNIHFQLTPSVLVAAENYRRKTGRKLRVVMTAHDYQLVCPNHMLYRPAQGTVCEKCLGGHYESCAAGRCIHNSLPRSVIGTMEAQYWNRRGTYQALDAVICPSLFLKEKLDTNPVLAAKTVLLRNFSGPMALQDVEKEDYVLYFGRYSEEKGLGILLEACRALPEIPFVFAGSGPLEPELEGIPNVRNVGFQSGEALTRLIQCTRFSVYPSVWYENCPFSVIESRQCGTPVLGADIGGIPELIQNGETGRLFEAGNAAALTEAIRAMWAEREGLERWSRSCLAVQTTTLEEYCRRLLTIYAPADDTGETEMVL